MTNDYPVQRLHIGEINQLRQMKGTICDDILDLSDYMHKHGLFTMLGSRKLDGKYIQIYNFDGFVYFITRGGLPFYLADVAKVILDLNLPPFMWEVELTYGRGVMGTRQKVGILTTWCTNYPKGIECNLGTDYRINIIRALDIEVVRGDTTAFKHLKYKLKVPFVFSEDTSDCQASLSLITYQKLRREGLDETYPVLNNISYVYHKHYTYDELRQIFNTMHEDKLEGMMLMPHNLEYKANKRVKNYLKLKQPHLMNMLCVDWLEGSGNFQGKVGSFVFQDEARERVSVSSGLSNQQRIVTRVDNFIGEMAEIQYESFDKSYVQPKINRWLGQVKINKDNLTKVMSAKKDPGFSF